VLKLFALPSLYRQMDMDRAAIYEADIKMLLARHKPEVISLFKVLEPYIPQTDLKELQKIVSEEQQRVTRSKDRFKN
jgi:hypothetical protein